MAVPIVWVGWPFAPAGPEEAEAVAADPIDTSNPAHSKAAITMFRCLCFTSEIPFMWGHGVIAAAWSLISVCAGEEETVISRLTLR